MTKPKEMLDLPKGSLSPWGLVSVALPLFVLLVSGLSAQSIPTGALPTGANVLAGNADVSSLGNHMLIRQVSPRAAIRWNDFNVGSAAHQLCVSAAHRVLLSPKPASRPQKRIGPSGSILSPPWAKYVRSEARTFEATRSGVQSPELPVTVLHVSQQAATAAAKLQ